MSTTTFSGPVKAGNIFNTTGLTLSENLSNQGQATMVQVAKIDEADPASGSDPVWSGIVIPANSQITRIALLVYTTFSSGMYIGRSDSVSSSASYFVDSTTVTTFNITTARGLFEVSTEANNTATAASSWKDTGALDVHLTTNNSTGSGTGTLIVEYIQNNNLTA